MWGREREILTSVSIPFHGKPAVAGSGFTGAELGEQDKDRRTGMEMLPQHPRSR